MNWGGIAPFSVSKDGNSLKAKRYTGRMSSETVGASLEA